MRYRETLKHVIKRVFPEYPRLVPVYLSKVDLDLEDAHMRLRVRIDYTTTTSLIISKEKKGYEQLFGFHLAVPMGLRESAHFFYMSAERHGKHHHTWPLCRTSTPA